MSGGQRAQVALTLVLAKRPELFLLDEPMANLDPLARREFLGSMFEACTETGAAVLFSSHVVAELERICDYLIVLSAGRVRLAGDIDELRHRHRIISGPAGWPLKGGWQVIRSGSAAGRTTALVLSDDAPVAGPGLEETAPTFDELVLGYAGCPPPDAHSGTFHVRSAATCQALKGQYPGGLQASFSTRYRFAILVFEDGAPAALAVIGALTGAPLVAREIEQRTQLAAWTQSVSRRHWYAAKVTVLAAGLAAAGLATGFANGWLQRPLAKGGLTSSRWSWFFSIHLALAGEAILAFALAVTIGAWLRRTLPAIGGALAGFVALLIGTGWIVRTLTPARHTTGPRLTAPPDGWIIGAPAGHGVPYHPASQYWPLQLAFLAILLALAAALLASGWHATRTRAV